MDFKILFSGLVLSKSKVHATYVANCSSTMSFHPVVSSTMIVGLHLQKETPQDSKDNSDRPLGQVSSTLWAGYLKKSFLRKLIPLQQLKKGGLRESPVIDHAKLAP